MPNQKNSDPHLISYRTLRRAVGILALSLPVMLVVGLLAYGCSEIFQPAISDYYYTVMSHVFVGTMCAIALFLYAYRGFDIGDMISARLACLWGLGVAFFPTYAPSDPSPCTNIIMASSSAVGLAHSVFAGLFFLTLAYISFFLFTKTSGDPTDRKIVRNGIYRVCGIAMVVAMLLVFVYFQVDLPSLEPYKPVFVLETIAVWAFGVSWLIKGETLFKDT